jgi:hypothetical protein
VTRKLLSGEAMTLCVLTSLVSLTSSSYAQSNSLDNVTVVVDIVRADDSRWGSKQMTRGLVRELKGKVGKFIDHKALLKALRAVKKGNKSTNRQRFAQACQSLGANYALLTRITRKGWLYTGKAVLLNCSNGELEMDFRAGFYDPAKEAQDRGYRIGKKAIEKLRFLRASKQSIAQTKNDAKPKLPSSPSTDSVKADSAESQITESTESESAESKSTESKSTESKSTESESAESESAESESTEDFGQDEFAAEFDDEESEKSEFDGLTDEGGWTWQVRGWLGAKYFSFLSPDLPDYKDRNFAKLGFRSTLSGRLGPDFRIRVLPLFEVNLMTNSIHRTTIEEGFLEYAAESVEFRLGWDSLSWGSATTVHVVDIINARDFTEGVMDAPKVGQPMFAARFLKDTHSLTLLYLTPFLPPQMPLIASPFSPFPRPPNAVEGERFGEKIMYGSKYEEWHPQAAARLSLILSSVDIHFAYFYGYARFPFVHLPTETTIFPLIQHASTDLQILIQGFSLKTEIAWVDYFETGRIRNPPISLDNGSPAQAIPLPNSRWKWNIGVEKTFDTFVGDTQFTPLVEFIGDSDSKWFTDDSPPDDITRFFENHLVYGFRWDFQNDYDSKLTFSDIIDLRNPADHLLTAEYEERWLQHFTFVIGGRLGLAEEGSKAAGNKELTGLYTSLRLSY